MRKETLKYCQKPIKNHKFDAEIVPEKEPVGLNGNIIENII